MAAPDAHAPREIIQIAGTGYQVVALCGDGTVWVGSFTTHAEGTGFVWRRVPNVPQEEPTVTLMVE